MRFERQFRNAVILFLNDSTVCKENREFYKEFFEKQEYKLKRRNSLTKLDEACYKTLYCYLAKFKNVNKWFNNKPLKDITKEDFQRFYDDFEIFLACLDKSKLCLIRNRCFTKLNWPF